MKRTDIYIRTLACWACYALALFGCSNGEELTPVTPDETRGLTVTFNVNNEARTATGGTAQIVYPVEEGAVLMGEQHTTDVFLYIFQGTGNEASYVACENVGWREHFGADLPVHTEDSRMTYTIQHPNFLYNVPYTLLAVGLSENAKNVYGFPDALGGDITLGEAKAALASGQSCNGINVSEIYVGTADFMPGSGRETEIELWRRVAGVAGYFCNVPSSLNGQAVQTLRISLYTKQNTQLPLLEQQQSPLFMDYIESPTTESDGEVLVEIPVTEFGTNKKVEGGAYVLPMPAPAGQRSYTLCVELVAANGTVLETRRAKLPEGDELDPGITGVVRASLTQRVPIAFPLWQTISMLWEARRILSTCKAMGQIL